MKVMTLVLDEARYKHLVEALDQYVQNGEEAEEAGEEVKEGIEPAREMLEELNLKRAELAGGVL